MNIQMLMKQAQEMQKKMSKIEKEADEKIYEKSLGGGAIQVKLKGSMQIEKISIDESLLEVENKEMLEEMLLSGLNELLDEAKKAKDKAMSSVTGGVKFPGGF